MKVLLLFLMVTFLLAIRGGRRNRPIRTWPLVVASTVVGAAFLSLRVI
jgi:hypothetical protein